MTEQAYDALKALVFCLCLMVIVRIVMKDTYDAGLQEGMRLGMENLRGCR